MDSMGTGIYVFEGTASADGKVERLLLETLDCDRKLRGPRLLEALFLFFRGWQDNRPRNSLPIEILLPYRL